MSIKSHRLFAGVDAVLEQNYDIESDRVCSDCEERRRMVVDTDAGVRIKASIA